MKGVTVEKPQAELKIVDDLEKPKPGPDQILVKSLYTAINPVDGYMANTGMLVSSWPWVVGCDAGGVVVEVGEKAATTFKVGDEVCGCTRLGASGHGTCQEFFLMDTAVTMPKPKNVSITQAATLGVGTETACLALFNGLHIDLPDPKALPEAKDEWIVILGGASSVGKYAVQIAKACGYKVVASCSARSAAEVRKLGANRAINYKDPLENQLKELLSIVKEKCNKVFDAAAANHAFAESIFKEFKEGPKYFSTTNDWDNIKDFAGGQTYHIELGPVGNPEFKDLNKDLERYISVIVQLIEDEKVVPNDYDVVGEGGWESILEAYNYQQKGAGGSQKVIVKIQDA